MKFTKRDSLTPALRGLACISAIFVPTFAHAVDWVGTDGLFGEGSNWDGGEVPELLPATIANGGNAEVVEGDEFVVQPLFVGGHDGAGELSISGGVLTAVGVPVAGGSHAVYIGGDNDGGGTGIGTVTITGGVFEALGGEMLFGSRGGTGTLNMSGGELRNNDWIIFGRDTGGAANVTLSGNAAVLKTEGGNHIAVGVNSGTTSTVTMTGQSSMVSNNEIRLGWLNSETTGIVNMDDGANLSAGTDIYVGVAGAAGELHMSGNAQVVAGSEFRVGQDGGSRGTVVMQDSAILDVAVGLVVGRGGMGSMTISDNAQVTAGGAFIAGADGSPGGTITVNGGSASGLWIRIGDGNSTGTLTINGGTVTATGLDNGSNPNDPAMGVRFRANQSNGATKTLNLNGGTLATAGFFKDMGDGPVDINFNGGTIKALADNDDFFAAGPLPGSTTFTSSDIDIQAGGLKFDTNGFQITIQQALNGEGGLTKLGEGTLTLTGANGYLGDTVVANGTLSITTGFLADGSNIFITTGSIFDLNFTGTDTVNALLIDGVAQALGTWGSLESNAEHKSELFSGTGMIEVTSLVVPEPSTMAFLCLAGIGGVLVLRRRRSS